MEWYHHILLTMIFKLVCFTFMTPLTRIATLALQFANPCNFYTLLPQMNLTPLLEETPSEIWKDLRKLGKCGNLIVMYLASLIQYGSIPERLWTELQRPFMRWLLRNGYISVPRLSDQITAIDSIIGSFKIVEMTFRGSHKVIVDPMFDRGP